MHYKLFVLWSIEARLMSFVVITHSIIIFNQLMLSVLILLQKPASIPKYLLAALVFIPAPFFITHLLFALFGYTTLTVQTIFISSSISPLFGPSLFFYICFMTGSKSSFVPRDLFTISYSFIPLAFWMQYLLQSPLKQLEFVRSVPVATDWEFILFDLLFIGSLFVFVFLSIREIRNFRNKLKEVYSYQISTRLEWISKMVKVVLWLNVFGLLTQGLIWLALPSFLLQAMNIVLTINVVIFYLFLLHEAFLRHSSAIDGADRDNVPESLAGKTERRLISYNSQQKEKVAYLFETDKIYLEPNLKLKDVADKSSIPAHVVSQIINNEFERSFFDFVNEYRVKHACQLLQSTHSDKIEAIGYDSGFNSKTAFYRAFKKQMGVSPLEFKPKV